MNEKQTQENNLAFIDGQNLYMGTNSDKPSWHTDLKKFRVYLRDKYKVSKAFYFLGCVIDGNDKLYDEIQDAGFILKFREHNSAMLGVKMSKSSPTEKFSQLIHPLSFFSKKRKEGGSIGRIFPLARILTSLLLA